MSLFAKLFAKGIANNAVIALPLGARGALIVEKKDDGAIHTTIVDASDDLLARKLPVKKTVEVGDSFCGRHFACCLRISPTMYYDLFAYYTSQH